MCWEYFFKKNVSKIFLFSFLFEKKIFLVGVAVFFFNIKKEIGGQFALSEYRMILTIKST